MGAEVRAEIVDAVSGIPVRGYEAEACVPITGDKINALVSWSSGAELPRTSKSVRLRIYLKGDRDQPRLYAVRFHTKLNEGQ